MAARGKRAVLATKKIDTIVEELVAMHDELVSYYEIMSWSGDDWDDWYDPEPLLDSEDYGEVIGELYHPL